METINLTANSAAIEARRDYPLQPDASMDRRKAGGEQPASRADVSVSQVDAAVDQLKSFVKEAQRNLDFSVDDSSGQFVVKVMDGDSGLVIRQIPSEELLRLSEQLENMRSLLFKAEA